ncbi:hypothetical protein EB118_12360 [bacterium]|nr:hypothetical protein [bacterium]
MFKWLRELFGGKDSKTESQTITVEPPKVEVEPQKIEVSEPPKLKEHEPCNKFPTSPPEDPKPARKPRAAKPKADTPAPVKKPRVKKNANV